VVGHRAFPRSSLRARNAHPIEASKAAVCYVRFTSIQDIARNVKDTQIDHLVFTLPAPIAPIVFQSKTVVYDLLFRAAADTLIAIAPTQNTWGLALASPRAAHLGLGSDSPPARAHCARRRPVVGRFALDRLQRNCPAQDHRQCWRMAEQQWRDAAAFVDNTRSATPQDGSSRADSIEDSGGGLRWRRHGSNRVCPSGTTPISAAHAKALDRTAAARFAA
jgi:hypothetical protein